MEKKFSLRELIVSNIISAIVSLVTGYVAMIIQEKRSDDQNKEKMKGEYAYFVKDAAGKCKVDMNIVSGARASADLQLWSYSPQFWWMNQPDPGVRVGFREGEFERKRDEFDAHKVKIQGYVMSYVSLGAKSPSTNLLNRMNRL